VDKVIYACDSCHYVFTNAPACERCPDCGKVNIRLASQKEQQEYRERKETSEDWG